jgi:hypothetical protein
MFLCNYKSGQARALKDTDVIRWFTLEELQNLEGKDELLNNSIRQLEVAV